MPPDTLLKFGYTPNGAIEFDSAAALLSFSYSGSPKAEIGAFGLALPDGEGLVIGHSAQVSEGGSVTPEFQILGTGTDDSTILLVAASASNSVAPSLKFSKNANGSHGDYSTIVADNEDIGKISWYGSDGVDGDTEIASIKVRVQDGSPEAGGIGGEIRFLVTTAGSVDSPSEALSLWNDLSANFAGDVIGNGSVYVGDTGNANMTLGMTINQAANDDEILALKSSDIGHGLTTGGADAETDTFFSMRKARPANGGVSLNAYHEDAAGDDVFTINSYGGTATTAKTTSANGLMTLRFYEHDGSNGLANITADGNVFVVKAQVGGSNVARFLVDEEGDMYSVTAGQTFDDYDDSAILDTYDMVRSGNLKGSIKAEFGKAMSMNEQTLIEMGVLGAPMSEGGLTNQTQLSRVLVGNARQQKAAHLNLAERVDGLTIELEAATRKLAALTA